MVEAAWTITLELAPWLLLGALIAGAMHVVLPGDFTRRQLSGRWGTLKAVALGVPLPLCSCGVIPVGLGLKRNGAGNGPVVGFLISTPQTGVDSILISASFLGWPFAALKVVAALITGVLGGWVAGLTADRRVSNTPSEPMSHPRVRSWSALAGHSIELVRSIWGWLVVGILVSAAITEYVPQDAFAGFGAYGGLSAMLLALLISMPLYVCAVSSAPIAAALVASGLPTGAAMVFLMAGPATNIATLGAVYRTLGVRALSVYLGSVVLGSVAAGMLFGFLLEGVAADQHMTHHEPAWWSIACAAVLVSLLAWFALADGLRWQRRRKLKFEARTQQGITVPVEGMTCEGCVEQLERRLNADEQVESAVVTLRPSQASVRGQVSRQRVCELVESAGFTSPELQPSVASQRE